MTEPVAKIIKDEEVFKDGLENLIASLGAGTDKRIQSKFTNRKLLAADGNQQELEALYETDWVAGKVVDIIPEDMTREWRSFIGEIDPELIDQLVEAEELYQLDSAFREAHQWSRLYGTAFILLVVDDGLDPSEPLELDNIRGGSLKHIKVLDRHRVTRSETVDQNPMSKNFGMPEHYRLVNTSVSVHHTRMLRFDGIKLPYNRLRENNYWSTGVIDRIYESILNFSTTTTGAASLVYETTVDVMKIKGLMSHLTTPEGEKNLRKRFTLASQQKSINNMLLLDSEEEYEKKSQTFAGLPDLIDRFSKMLAAATDIPATRLLGTSASGLNATGEGDLKNYYDKVRSLQKAEYKPLLDYFDQILIRSLGLPEDTDVKYEFNSLFQMSDSEKATIQLNNAQRDQIYLDNNVVTEEIIAKELKENGTYTNITDDYIDELEEFSNGFDDPAPEPIIPEGQGQEEGEENPSNQDPEES